MHFLPHKEAARYMVEHFCEVMVNDGHPMCTCWPTDRWLRVVRALLEYCDWPYAFFGCGGVLTNDIRRLTPEQMEDLAIRNSVYWERLLEALELPTDTPPMVGVGKPHPLLEFLIRWGLQNELLWHDEKKMLYAYLTEYGEKLLEALRMLDDELATLPRPWEVREKATCERDRPRDFGTFRVSQKPGVDSSIIKYLKYLDEL